MIVIYCSTFGLRSIYKVSALLLIISGLLTTDNAVRIQVAQLERLSSEGRFLCVGLVWLVGGERGLLPNPWLSQATDLMQASVSSSKQPMQSITSRHLHPSLLSFLFGYLILTLRWLSRYDSDLLLDLWSALYL